MTAIPLDSPIGSPLEVTGNLPQTAIGNPLAPEQPLPGPIDAAPVNTVETEGSHPNIRIFTAKAGDHSPEAQETRILAQQLHTAVYLTPAKPNAQPLITEDMLNDRGLYVDQYSDRADYHYVRNGNKVTAARQVFCTKKEGILSLPTAEHFELDPEKIKEAAGVERLSDIGHDEAVEISGLVARKKEANGNEVLTARHRDMDAVVTLYVQMIRNSLEAGHKLWLMNVDPPFARRLSMLVGQEQLHTLGEAREYMGPPSVPVALNPQEVARVILASDEPRFAMQKETFKRVFVGIDDQKIPKDIRELLDANGIERSRPPLYKRIIKSGMSKMALAQASMMGFTVARDVAAVKSGTYNGDPTTLVGIDASTSYFYVKGLARMYAGKTVGSKVAGAMVAAPAYAAPYWWYLSHSSESHSNTPKIVAGALVGGAVLREVVSRKRRNHKDQQLATSLQAEKTH